MAVSAVPEWFAYLENEDVQFIKRFVLASGSLKEVAGQYGVSYPTVRLRLDKLIRKMQQGDVAESDPFVALVRQLAMEDKLDLDTAKLLVQEYKKERGK